MAKSIKDRLDALEKPSEKKSMKKSIEDLSNMVFGLALSIGALTLINSLNSTNDLIVSGILTFGFSFCILIYTWLRYTKILELIKFETKFETLLNIIMLFLVVIEPFTFNLLHTSSYSLASDLELAFTTSLFGLDIGGMLLVLGLLYSIGLKGYKGTERSIISSYRYVLLITGITFIVTTLPWFWTISFLDIPLRILLWAAVLLGTFAFRDLIWLHGKIKLF